MRSLLRAVVAGFALLCLACGGRRAPKPVAGLPAEAFAPLTEDDVARFARVLPALAEYLDWHGSGSSEKVKVRDDMAKVLAAGVEWIPKTAGVDSVLAANGVDWPFIRAMLYRLSVCAWAVGIESGEEERQRMIRSQTTRAMASALRKRLSQMKEIVAAVPPANVEVFKRHYRELEGFFSIVDI